MNTLLTALTTVSTHTPREGGRRTGFTGGYLTGLSTHPGNPKAGVFAVSVLPQPTVLRGPSVTTGVVLLGLGAAVAAGV